MISIVMPSYLGQYKRAAKDRDTKILRAISSVTKQCFREWELIIVADGCERTLEIVDPLLSRDERLRLEFIEKAPLWSGRPRNTGISLAQGKYICYLDIDDIFAPDHLSSMLPEMDGQDWYWFDDYKFNIKDRNFRHVKRNVNKLGNCGTSNIMHRPHLAKWNDRDNYAHDWRFIQKLKKASRKYKYIKGGRYLVCHIPGEYDV